MKLNYDRKSKDPTYFIQVGIRNGKKVTTKNVERIGKHSELLKITDDPLEYAKQRVKEYNENIKNSKVEYNITVNFDDKVINQGNTVSKSTCKNTGYFYLKELYSSLGISDFFDKVCSGRKIAFNPNMINMVLTFSRILDPGSKMHTLKNLTGFYGDFDFSHQDILRFMDILEENYDEYLSHLFESSNKVIKRNTNVCYFDCTNFYFEKESEENFTNELLGKVCDNANVEIPAVMIDAEVDRMYKEFEGRMQQSGFTAKQFLEATHQTEEAIRAQMSPEAAARVKTQLVLEAIVKAESIEASDEDVEKEFTTMSEMYNMEVEKIKSLISPESIKADLANQKALDFIKTSVK